MNFGFRSLSLLHYNLRSVAPTIKKTKGIYLYDSSGKQYIDGSSGPVVCNIGHGVKEIGEAYAAQAEKVAYVFRSHFTSEPVEKLAALIAEMAPKGLDRVFLFPVVRRAQRWRPRSTTNIIWNGMR